MNAKPLTYTERLALWREQWCQRYLGISYAEYLKLKVTP